MDLYQPEHRELQEQFETRNLADRLEQATVRDVLSDDYAQFIESRDFFFLSTVNAAGEPTVSYKGGPVGVVKILDPKTLAFPLYDGNGMFLSAGNVNASAKIGMLFIAFDRPQRVRVQATAQTSTDPADLELFPGSQLIVRATVDAAFVNCGRYIHKHDRVASSKHVPDAVGQQPFAAWKRIDFLQDVVAPGDQGLTEENGGVISVEEYAAMVDSGES